MRVERPPQENVLSSIQVPCHVFRAMGKWLVDLYTSL